MTSKKRPKNRAPHRTSTRKPSSVPPRLAAVPGEDELPELDLLAGLDDALRQPHPFALLAQASSIMAALDERQKGHPAARADPEELGISLTELCDSFMDVGLRQTDALLKVIEAMTPDELLAERIRRSVAERKLPIPGWTLRLEQAEPHRIVEMLHVLRDGDNVCIGVHLPNDRELSIMIYIDHNLGTVVKDAFVLDLPVEDVIARWAEIDNSDDTEIRELSFADARTRITEATFKGSITFPPFETETWPACRPLVEWIVSKLPEGGKEYERPEWSAKQLAELTDDFFDSEFGRRLDDDDHRSLLESILWFGTDYGPGDPLRWSPVSAEIVLGWMPRKVVGPVDFLTKTPDLLRAFVRFSHAARGISADLTLQTLAAVDEFESDFHGAIRSQPQDAEAILEQLVSGGGPRLGVENGWLSGGLITDEDLLTNFALAMVGSRRALDEIDTIPLPNEPFDWDGLPSDIHDKVGEVVTLVDGCSDEFFDVEFRTACRRFVHRVATADPAVFRGKARAHTTAAAVCVIIGRANDFFLGDPGEVRVKDITARLGVGPNVAARADPMLRAIGADEFAGGRELGDAALLLADTRELVIRFRDQHDVT
ncbi:DUF6398 domain-containing protein [Glaciibacter superstes]|uniref:DUF6398 domain-containing protein n=1 Tax=Glaciibacter superstes TaxID=501023 RepID=UPI0003B48324|nr:DUF6398 domain-containing protein [Glaciibacter superstes]